MYADRRIHSLMALALIMTITSCDSSGANSASVGSDTAQAVPDPRLPGHGVTPPANTEKSLEAQKAPRQAGIGAALGIKDGKVLVTKVLPDSPAERTTLIHAKDEVVAVAEGNGPPIDVRGTKDIAKVVGMIRGPVGTTIRLTMVPNGKGEADQLVVSLIRGDIKEINMFVDGRLLPLDAKAPNFKFTRLGDANESDLSHLAGRIVVVDFWASWCGACINSVEEMGSLQEQHPEWAGQIELLAVSVDESKEAAIKVCNSRHWSKTSTVWAGPDALKLYRVSGLPTTFVIDRNGTVAAVDHHLDIAAVIKRLLSRPAKKADRRSSS